MEPILQIRNLCRHFPLPDGSVLTAVDHLSLDLYAGETLGIIGQSGSGKSTLAGLITCLDTPDEGSICLKGADLTGDARARLTVWKTIQMVFQTPVESFDPRHTLGSSIAEPLRNTGVSRRAAVAETERLLSLCGLTADFARRYPHEVSGGQCQRASIARALAAGPEILICDEATSALDVTIQQEILALLNDLKRRSGMACLFISHDLALVSGFCDRVLVMYHGKIVEEGTPEKVLYHPEDPYTRQLIDAALL